MGLCSCIQKNVSENIITIKEKDDKDLFDLKENIINILVEVISFRSQIDLLPNGSELLIKTADLLQELNFDKNKVYPNIINHDYCYNTCMEAKRLLEKLKTKVDELFSNNLKLKFKYVVFLMGTVQYV